MKKSLFLLAIITIAGFLFIVNISFIHAQGYAQFFQPPQYLAQFGYPWGFQTFMPGFFSRVNLNSQTYFTPQRNSFGSSQALSYPDAIYSSSGLHYIPLNQTTYDFNSPPTRNPLYGRSSFNSDIPPGLPDLSSIAYNPSMGAYYAPQLSHWEGGPKYFSPGSIFFTYDYTGRDWTLYFFQNSPALYSNGTLLTAQGSSQVQTITIEDDGKTFTFKPGEMFRIVLPMYDDISKEDFSLVAAWDEEGRGQWGPASIDSFGFEPKSIGLKTDEDGNLVQENTYRALKARPDSKELVFNYHGPSGRNDTFRVTVRIQGSGNYAPSY